MDRIGNGTATEAVLDRLLNSGSTTTALSSPRRSLADHELAEMETLASQMVANYSGQSLVEGQAELWMQQWSAIALKHGLHTLREALWEHMGRSRFMPCLADVNECVAIVRERRRADREAASAKAFMDDMQKAKAQWERERKLPGLTNAVQVKNEVMG